MQSKKESEQTRKAWHKSCVQRESFQKTKIAIGIFIASLALGILGYKFISGMGWLNALLNASMILSGMGPTNIALDAKGKLFASAYALYSGIFFLVFFAIIVDDIVQHRFCYHIPPV